MGMSWGLWGGWAGLVDEGVLQVEGRRVIVGW